MFCSTITRELLSDFTSEEMEIARGKSFSVELPESLLTDLRKFLRQDRFYVVRSSASKEDSSDASFAGLFSSILNVRGTKNVADGIKQCWSSQFSDGVLTYCKSHAISIGFDLSIIVQAQIRSSVSGVCFTRFSYAEASVLEAIFGQNEALVSGILTPDSWTVKDGNIISKKISAKPFKLDIGDEKLRQVPLSHEQANSPSLGDEKVLLINKIGLDLEHYLNTPVDMEWTIDENGAFWVLQARPVTRLKCNFVAPGPGTWTYDPVHFPGPFNVIARNALEIGFSKGFFETSNECGALLAGVTYRVTDERIVFEQLEGRKPEEMQDCFAKASSYYTNKKWNESYDHWKTKILEQRHQNQMALKSLDLVKMTDLQLASHLECVLKELEESFRAHHLGTFGCLTGLGYFLNEAAALVGKDPNEILQLLSGTAPRNRGIWDPVFAQTLCEALRDDEVRNILSNARGSAGLASICKSESPLGKCIRHWMRENDHKVISGFDCGSKTYSEVPDLVLEHLRDIMCAGKFQDLEINQKKKLSQFLDEIPTEKHSRFLELLAEGIRMNEWRDQRGLLNEVPAQGLVRLTLREIGSRFSCIDPQFSDWEILLQAKEGEICEALQGKMRLKRLLALCRARQKFIPDQIPRFLGTPPMPPPDLSSLPHDVKKSEEARWTAFSRIMFVPPAHEKDVTKLEDFAVQGLTANGGSARGRVRIIESNESLAKISQGDVCVAITTSCAFNSVLPKCVALITDVGGVLCHAAVTARELGLPCIVATGDATKVLKDGEIVFVDADKGKVFKSKK